MNRLPLLVDLHSDETPASFVSRLAARNGTSADGLCLDLGLAFRKVVDGHVATLHAIADAGAADAKTILDNAFARISLYDYLWRGHELHTTVLRSGKFAFCPECVAADAAASRDLPPYVRAYGRSLWRIECIETCSDHCCEFVVVEAAAGHRYDFARNLAGIRSSLAGSNSVVRREPTAFENYVRDKMQGIRSSLLLDPLPLAHCVRVVDTIGAMILGGREAGVGTLSERNRQEARQRGFDVLAPGSESFTDFLRGLQGHDPRKRQDGVGSLLGSLHRLLNDTRHLRGYDAIRNVVLAYVSQNIVGGQSFYQASQARKIHSVHTLAKTSGIHPKLLRKRLWAVGVVDDAQMQKSDNNVKIEAEAAERAIREMGGLLSLKDAIAHLGASRPQMDILIAAGLIEPRLKLSQYGGRDTFASKDLDRFLAQLAKGSSPTTAVSRKYVTIPAAARRAHRSAADIIRLVLDGRLSTRTLPGKPRYMGILVDVNEAKQAVRLETPDGLSFRRAAQEICVSDPVLAALVKHGHLKTVIVKNPVTRFQQRIVPLAEIARFKEDYISLTSLAKLRRRFAPILKIELERDGVLPAFDHSEIGARFYARPVQP